MGIKRGNFNWNPDNGRGMTDYKHRSARKGCTTKGYTALFLSTNSTMTLSLTNKLEQDERKRALRTRGRTRIRKRRVEADAYWLLAIAGSRFILERR